MWVARGDKRQGKRHRNCLVSANACGEGRLIYYLSFGGAVEDMVKAEGSDGWLVGFRGG